MPNPAENLLLFLLVAIPFFSNYLKAEFNLQMQQNSD